jgi:2-polyprenyl-3-methyl-5-hydroxy-6-metoxy-1,4-benzoquinol methylase
VIYLRCCPLCEGRHLDPFGLDAWEPFRLHLSQSKCRRCGLLVSQPQAALDELIRYYRQTHFEEINTDPDENFATIRRIRCDWDVPLMKELWQDFAPRAGGLALEVGCGYGGLLSVLLDEGFSVVGCDMSMKCASFCHSSGIRSIVAGSPGLPFPRRSFDLVIAMHVIEHVPDPVVFALEIVGLLRPGGVVVLGTEDGWCSQYQWERLKSHVLGRVPPFRTSNDHTFVFQGSHLRSLLKRAGCDFVAHEVLSHCAEGEPALADL